MTPTIKFRRLDGYDATIALPSYQTAGAAGADVRANFVADLRDGGLTLAPLARAVIPTGLGIEIPDGFEVQVRMRSGLALKHGLTLPNAPGTIDSDYRGHLGVIVMNAGDQPVTIAHGDRIAQLIVAPVVQAEFVEVEDLSETARGAGGYGSTGVSQ
ncbi:Deoxyuridine 5'-triphosphate nucleotidohydrolase [Ketogulonicigenium robustum]|uniref:Deoxyuridine 5'-triphosphate nucleotidohydrolase n=1 Tax=Ketogulonicigenium robustum TaxID=92947 RepID=A0A1W6NWK8_9RHOB|nr:dUTP diphosphatase [Ketogulonicigenium robustum]ARO13626.1 Deoxyuridine 5'-triphosphate nucleotidohydrolase [Ketogulonicigenium robustum]